MAEIWPSGVNQDMEPNSYQEQPEDGVLSFDPEVGPPIRRRRSAIAMSLMGFTTVLDRAQLIEFKQWYRDVLASGAKSFTRKHPFTRDQGTFMFTTPPKFTAITLNKTRATFAMRELP